MHKFLQLILAFSVFTTNFAIGLSHNEAQIRLDAEGPDVALNDNNITIQLDNEGSVRGLRCPTTEVNQYLGIPFALAPVGSLRFASPQPYNQPINIDVTLPPPACPQFKSLGGESEPWSKDCLFVNVWTPASATPASQLPIKVFLHGGANVAGSISNPLWTGCYSAENIIQVNVAYRLGPLGFLASESLGVKGNLGIEDQLFGLRWVEESIGAFGGDPEKIMLFGESAGAFNTWIINMLPQAKGLIHAAIMQSGGLLPLQTSSSLKETTNRYLAGPGCNDSDLVCIQQASLTDLNATYWTTLGATWPSGVIQDGAVIPEQPVDSGPQVPSIIGSNANEGTVFFVPPYAANEL